MMTSAGFSETVYRGTGIRPPQSIEQRQCDPGPPGREAPNRGCPRSRARLSSVRGTTKWPGAPGSSAQPRFGQPRPIRGKRRLRPAGMQHIVGPTEAEIPGPTGAPGKQREAAQHGATGGCSRRRGVRPGRALHRPGPSSGSLGPPGTTRCQGPSSARFTWAAARPSWISA